MSSSPRLPSAAWRGPRRPSGSGPDASTRRRARRRSATAAQSTTPVGVLRPAEQTAPRFTPFRSRAFAGRRRCATGSVPAADSVEETRRRPVGARPSPLARGLRRPLGPRGGGRRLAVAERLGRAERLLEEVHVHVGRSEEPASPVGAGLTARTLRRPSGAYSRRATCVARGPDDARVAGQTADGPPQTLLRFFALRARTSRSDMISGRTTARRLIVAVAAATASALPVRSPLRRPATCRA